MQLPPRFIIKPLQDLAPNHYVRRIFGIATKWLSEMIKILNHVRPELARAPFASAPRATEASLSRDITTHCNDCVVDVILIAPLRVLGSRSLIRGLRFVMRRRVNSANMCLSAVCVPLQPQWSTVFPHTNTFCAEFRAPCSANICFPKRFGYRAPLARSRARSGLDRRLSAVLCLRFLISLTRSASVHRTISDLQM